jgi:hypothetical protein
MKKISFVTCLLLLASCSMSQKFPDKMPSDFKIEYHLDGGMANMNRTIILQNGECSDKGREDDGPDYDYKISISNPQELETLYTDLKKLKVFTIKAENKGDVVDRGGESIRFTIGGKIYDVNNSQSNFISKEDAPAFNNAVKLILTFAESHRLPEIIKTEKDEETNTGNNAVDSTSVVKDQAPTGGNIGNLGQTEQPTDDKIHGNFPPKMPNDFRIEYNMSAGISGGYRKVTLQYGSSTDEGKKAGESKYSNSFMNMNLKDYEALYNELYKLKAFELEYTTNNKVADRGGEMLTFTINGKSYKVSDKDTDYIKASDKAAFKKSITLVLEYVDKTK